MSGHEALLFLVFAEPFFAIDGFDPGNGEARAKNLLTFFISSSMVEHLWFRVMLP